MLEQGASIPVRMHSMFPPELASIPLEDIDPFYHNQRVSSYSFSIVTWLVGKLYTHRMFFFTIDFELRRFYRPFSRVIVILMDVYYGQKKLNEIVL